MNFDKLQYELALLELKLFDMKYKLSDEIIDVMKVIIKQAPTNILEKDYQSVLRYAYTSALARIKKCD